ncbi:MAG TPA: ABC transporter permease [Cyclobacteriaceae bacterium]|nr:ABC transporter permease [Cyclobacteriaceae bacterium]
MKSRLSSTINVIALTCGITCFLLAILYWKDESGFDNFHENANLSRITTSRLSNTGVRIVTGTTGQVQGSAFKDAIPEIDTYVRVMGGDIRSDVTGNNNALRITPLFVDPTFFEVFTFPMLYGNSAAALREINGVVLTEKIALKFYGRTDVLGEVLTIDSDPSFDRLERPLLVTGVVKDPPANSSIQFDALLPFGFMQLAFDDRNWLNAYLGTFVLLHPGSDLEAVTRKFEAVYETYGRKQLGNPDYDYFKVDPEIHYGLQSMEEIHLNPLTRSDGSNESGIVNESKLQYSIAFVTIAGFILAMASINFITITISSTLRRAKEVGVRKISGGRGSQLVTQFLTESALVCVTAFVLSIGMLYVLLPSFNDVADKSLVFADMFDWRLTIYFGLALILVIIVAGLYPAWLLTKLKVVDVLHRQVTRGTGGHLSSRALLTFQLSIGAFLLIGALTYQSQMSFIRTKDLGYDPHNIIQTEVFGNRNAQNVIAFMRNELEKEPSIVTTSFGNKGRFEDVMTDQHQFSSMVKRVDENYLDLMNIPVVDGRNFSSGSTADTEGSVLVNETFVRNAGWVDPIGQTIRIRDNPDTLFRKVIGVVKDYHFRSLREPIMPLVLSMKTESDQEIWVKFNQSQQKEAISALSRVYQAAAPGALFQYQFFDEANAKDYFAEQRWQSVVNFATLLAAIICCSGLFGLASLSASHRTKEIGIRKVLGASIRQIASMITLDFLKVVTIALAIALPLSQFAAGYWLSGFAYHIDSVWGILALAAIMTISISIITVGLRALKAAIVNPVESLRRD